MRTVYRRQFGRRGGRHPLRAILAVPRVTSDGDHLDAVRVHTFPYSAGSAAKAGQAPVRRTRLGSNRVRIVPLPDLIVRADGSRGIVSDGALASFEGRRVMQHRLCCCTRTRRSASPRRAGTVWNEPLRDIRFSACPCRTQQLLRRLQGGQARRTIASSGRFSAADEMHT